MNNKTYRTIIYALLLGFAIFIMPMFILKVITFLIIAGVLIRFFIYRQIRRFTNTIKNRSNTKYYNAKADYSYNKYGKHKVQTIEIEAKEL